MWLLDERLPDYWKPNKSKIVVNAMIENGTHYVAFVVDPQYPGRWREQPWFSDIKTIAQRGIDGFLGETWTTIVMIKDERIPIIGTASLVRRRSNVA